MIVKRNFTPAKILPYVWKELLFVAVASTAVCTALVVFDEPRVTLPFGPIGVLGTALAILLGFRNNTGYARWWEARSIWAQIGSTSRTMARLVVSGARNAALQGKGGDAAELAAYTRELVYRQIAFAHALRLQLRREDRWDELAPFLAGAELDRVRAAANPSNLLLQRQGDRLKDGVREEKLGAFDPISLEPNLAALATAQGGCEKIKHTPLLRQYEFFTRVFLWTFLALLPSSILGVFAAGPARWLAVPIALALAFVYTITTKTGQVTEDPFENRIHDVPMTALCNAIERDLREQLGERDLPAPAAAIDGYLF